MKHLKKIWPILLVATLLMLFVACDKTPDTPDTSTVADTDPATQAPEDPTNAEETDPESELSTETPTEARTEAPTEPEKETVPEDVALPYTPSNPAELGDWKGIWLSQFDLQNVYHNASGAQNSEAQFRMIMEKLLNNVVKDHYNTIVVQVRPNADSMYPSEYYPPSKYVVGAYGNDFTYDPFAIIVELAHKKGLDVHAWINPMRGMSDDELKAIDEKYTIKQWYNDSTKKGTYITLQEKGGTVLWYLNPAYEEVRKLIVDGAREIMQKYDVKGVHMDDYFYPVGPDQTAFDQKAYRAYCQQIGKIVSVADFRRDCLDKLVSELYAGVKKENIDALFGISPAGNLDTVMNSHCADVENWCANPGYVDYIMPQVYFGFEHKSHAFDKVCNTWQSIIKTDYVKLIIGVTFGKAQAGVDNYAGDKGMYEWRDHKDIMKRSLEYSMTLEKCVGMTVFCYQYLYDPSTGALNNATRQEHTAFVAVMDNATWPASKKDN